MLIEAIARPIRYCLADGKQMHLTPGIPTDLPEPPAPSATNPSPNESTSACTSKASTGRPKRKPGSYSRGSDKYVLSLRPRPPKSLRHKKSVLSRGIA